jgi:hypothetical protein
MLDLDHMRGNYDESTNKILKFGFSPVTVLDEIHHGLSKKNNNTKNEHINLFTPLKEEIDSGIITPGPYFILQVEAKYDNP